ncbi:MAG: divalent metal cation transporter, partial [Candidatus Hydrogenedentes bacterium]|nr:divalent metal cation transporter [Candidatus Hydrogenedentota bacterium]
MSTDNSSKPTQRFWERLGPGIITASVVLGPGSIMASSKAGASGGYHLLWLLFVAAFVMAVYTAMGARLGCALTESPLEYIAQKYGRALALL